jgi:putative 4-mercaptohistidine N1-methyltranferase
MFQHACFYYVQNQSGELEDKMNVYETDTLVSQYLEFHYGSQYFDMPNFPLACVAHIMKYCTQTRLRALDLGCAVGRASFELAKHFVHVDGIDFSAHLIQQAIKLQEEGHIKYTVITEGDCVANKEMTLSALGYEQLIHKIKFIQGDACNLKPIFRDYDLIFCGNLIDRLYDPALFLQHIGARLAPKGLLVLTSPYTWLEAFTQKKHWLGGIKVDGETQTTFDGLRAILTPQFKLLEVLDVPFVIRETQRKFQHSVAQMTIWKLKDNHKQV